MPVDNSKYNKYNEKISKALRNFKVKKYLILFFLVYNINTPGEPDIVDYGITLQHTEGDPIREFIRFIIL